MLEFLMMGGVKARLTSAAYLYSGNKNGSLYNAIDQYAYANDTLTVAIALAAGQSGLEGTSTGNSVLGLHTKGSFVLTTLKHIYSANALAAGSSLTQGLTAPAGSSTATKSYIIGGYKPGYVLMQSVLKYTYVSDVQLAARSLIFAKVSAAAVGTNDFYLVAAGTEASGGTKTSEKHMIAADTNAAGTSLGKVRIILAACGNQSMGLFGGGANAMTNYTDRYMYASDAVSPGTVLGLARHALAATGNAMGGIFTGGSVTLTYTDKYVYSADTVTPGTALTIGRHDLKACSSSPGGF